MQRTREVLTVFLLALLPFHALLVTVGTKLIEGPGHAPLTVLALWKEALLGAILLIAFLEWCRKPQWKLDLLDWLILALLILSIAVTAITHGDFKLYLYGFKYDFVPLVAFLVLRRVPWSDACVSRLLKWILIVAGVVSVYGILSFYLPLEFFVWLGYSDLHSLYLADGPLAAFQQIGGSSIRRVQSTMSGPNQLGLWLLLPLSIALVRTRTLRHWGLMVGVFVLFTMFLTLSRSALLGAGVIVALILWERLPRQQFYKFVGGLFLASCVISLVSYFTIPEVAVRAASTRGHIKRPLEAVQTMVKHPLGLGLGTAGPASNRMSDTCVHLGEGADGSWAADRPELCVFVGDTQVQPRDRTCTCPLLPENWYLQLGVEMGILGFALFVLLVFLLLRRLLTQPLNGAKTPIAKCAALSFVGVSVAALFLHAWEDAALAYSVWIVLSMYFQREPHPN